MYMNKISKLENRVANKKNVYHFFLIDMLLISKELRYWVSLHYLFNSLACLVYVFTKVWQPVCTSLFELDENGECQLDWRDTEILMFLCFIVVLKNRRWKPLTAVEYVANLFLFGKCANCLLFFRQDLRWGILYSIFCLLLFFVFPEPSYSGPEKITYFRGQALDEKLLQNPEESLVVEFFAPWSPPCTRFSSTFGQLSLQYDNEYLKFGKLDVNKYEKVAQKYRIDISASSKNLPTVIVFENGKEKARRPTIDAAGSVKSYQFKAENLIRDLDLNELYAGAKQKAKNKSRKKD